TLLHYVPQRNITITMCAVVTALDRTSQVGRPRDPQIGAAVVEATLAILDQSGYGRLMIEEVARRAGTTKPTVYRRGAARPRPGVGAPAGGAAPPGPPGPRGTPRRAPRAPGNFLAPLPPPPAP